jgi:DNA replication ATP-dependent helicase Dna2
LGLLFDQKTSHLKSHHSAFLSHWNDHLTREETGAQSMRSEIWSMSAEEREAVGRCFSQMKIVHETAHTTEEGINVYEYEFQKAYLNGNGLSKSTITVGDAIVVSQDRGPYGLSIGFVVEMTSMSLTVSVDHYLQKGTF